MKKTLAGLMCFVVGMTSGLTWAADEKGMARRISLERQVTQLMTEVKRLKGNTVLKLGGVVDLQGVDGQPTAVFSAINVLVVNGTGDQVTLNGRGNLTVGYNGPRALGDPVCSDSAYITQGDCEGNGKVWAMHHTSRSHNLVVGIGNSHSIQGAR